MTMTPSEFRRRVSFKKARMTRVVSGTVCKKVYYRHTLYRCNRRRYGLTELLTELLHYSTDFWNGKFKCS